MAVRLAHECHRPPARRTLYTAKVEFQDSLESSEGQDPPEQLAAAYRAPNDCGTCVLWGMARLKSFDYLYWLPIGVVVASTVILTWMVLMLIATRGG